MARVGLELPFGITPVKPRPVDGYKYNEDNLPYANTAEIESQIPLANRYLGQTFFVDVGGGSVEEYWFKNSVTNESLVIKHDGGGSSGTYTPGDLTWVSPEKVGGYPAGTTSSSLNGNSLSKMWDDLLFPTVYSSITTNKSVVLSKTGTASQVEIGSTMNVTLTAVFNQGVITWGNGVGTTPLVGGLDGATPHTFTGTGIAGPTAQASPWVVSPVPIAVEGLNSWAVSTAHLAGTDPYYDNKGVIDTSLDASRIAGSVVDSASSPTVRGYYYIFYGLGGSNPTNSAEVRALDSGFDTSNEFQFNSGTSDIKFKIVVPQGRTVTGVLQEDVGTGASYPITSSFIDNGLITVSLPNGATRDYRLYVMDNAIPYTSDQYLKFTLTG